MSNLFRTEQPQIPTTKSTTKIVDTIAGKVESGRGTQCNSELQKEHKHACKLFPQQKRALGI